MVGEAVGGRVGVFSAIVGLGVRVLTAGAVSVALVADVGLVI